MSSNATSNASLSPVSYKLHVNELEKTPLSMVDPNLGDEDGTNLLRKHISSIRQFIGTTTLSQEQLFDFARNAHFPAARPEEKTPQGRGISEWKDRLRDMALPAPVTLTVTLQSAHNLLSNDIGSKNDPFAVLGVKMLRRRSKEVHPPVTTACKILEKEQQLKSSTCKNTNDPTWNESFTFKIRNCKYDVFLLDLWDSDIPQWLRDGNCLERCSTCCVNDIWSNDYIGSVNISIEDIPALVGIDQKYNLHKPKDKDVLQEKDRGTVRLRLRVSGDLFSKKEFYCIAKKLLTWELSHQKDRDSALSPECDTLLHQAAAHTGLLHHEYLIQFHQLLMELEDEGVVVSWSGVWLPAVTEQSRMWLRFKKQLQNQSQTETEQQKIIQHFREFLLFASDELMMCIVEQSSGKETVSAETVSTILKCMKIVRISGDDILSDSEWQETIKSKMNEAFWQIYSERRKGILASAQTVTVTDCVASHVGLLETARLSIYDCMYTSSTQHSEADKVISVGDGSSELTTTSMSNLEKEDQGSLLLTIQTYSALLELAELVSSERYSCSKLYGDMFAPADVNFLSMFYESFTDYLDEDVNTLLTAPYINRVADAGETLLHCNILECLRCGTEIPIEREEWSLVALSFETYSALMHCLPDRDTMGDDTVYRSLPLVREDINKIFAGLFQIFCLYQIVTVGKQIIFKVLSQEQKLPKKGSTHSSSAGDTLYLLNDMLIKKFWKLITISSDKKSEAAKEYETDTKELLCFYICDISYLYCNNVFNMVKDQQYFDAERQFDISKKLCTAVSDIHFVSTEMVKIINTVAPLASKQSTTDIATKLKTTMKKVGKDMGKLMLNISGKMKPEVEKYLKQIEVAPLYLAADSVLDRGLVPYIEHNFSVLKQTVSEDMLMVVVKTVWDGVLLVLTRIISSDTERSNAYYQRFWNCLLICYALFHANGLGLPREDMDSDDFIHLKSLVLEWIAEKESEEKPLLEYLKDYVLQSAQFVADRKFPFPF